MVNILPNLPWRQELPENHDAGPTLIQRYLIATTQLHPELISLDIHQGRNDPAE